MHISVVDGLCLKGGSRLEQGMSGWPSGFLSGESKKQSWGSSVRFVRWYGILELKSREKDIYRKMCHV